MVKEEPINRDAHLLRETVRLLRLGLGLGDPVLELGLAHDAVAVELVTAAHERVERLLGVVLEQVHPDRVVPALEPGPAEVVRVHARTKAITLNGKGGA